MLIIYILIGIILGYIVYTRNDHTLGACLIIYISYVAIRSIFYEGLNMSHEGSNMKHISNDNDNDYKKMGDPE
jgi:hypothetical protein